MAHWRVFKSSEESKHLIGRINSLCRMDEKNIKYMLAPSADKQPKTETGFLPECLRCCMYFGSNRSPFFLKQNTLSHSLDLVIKK